MVPPTDQDRPEAIFAYRRKKGLTTCRHRLSAAGTVWRYDDVSSHLVLRDGFGHRLELDPRVLTADPLLWHELDTGVRRSVERGTLLQGADVLNDLGHSIDDETARAALRASGLS